MTRTLAIIPARSGSKRVPHKNRREFLGKPLILWTIEFALSQPAFDSVVVSTDSEIIASISRSAGALVPYLRSSDLASDNATSVDVALDVLDRMASKSFDRVALLQPTTPVRFVERWHLASDLIDRGADSVVGVRFSRDHPCWTYFLSPDGELDAFNPTGLTLRSQDLPAAVVPNGSMYLVRSSVLRSKRMFVAGKSRAVVCSEPIESIDIDTEEDWMQAENLVSTWKAGI